MKFKKLIGRVMAFMLAGTMMFSSTPVYADTAANSGADVFATQSSNFTIRIPKQLVLSGNEGTGAYRVAVKGNISGTDIITVTPDAEFYMKQEGKSDILATITQPKTNFTYADGVRPETEVISDGVIEMASISAGKWSGLFNFTVTSSVDLSLEDSIGSDKADINGSVIGDDVSQDKHSEYDVITSETRTPIKVTATNSDGVDINASASTIVGSEAKKLLDSLNESGLIEDTEEVDALIEVESDDFEGIADTTFDVSDIANSGDTVVILHFDEEKQMWEHIGTETVDENGKVNGDFTSYSPVAFVKVDNNGNIETHLHNFEKSNQEPTCTETGLKIFTCSECFYVYKEVIDALGHDYETSSTASSCTEEGYTIYTCERCGDSYVDDTVPALGHSYGDWVTVKEQNCTETGSKQKTCSACGDVVTESINALGHSWNSDYTVDKEATCTVTGSKSIHCSVCNATKDTTTIPVKEHSYSNWTTVKEPNCTETGSKQKTCSACGDVVTESINALGHSWNSDYTVDKEATCTVTGSKSIHCSVCNVTKDTTTIPVKEHSYGNWTTVKEPTCTETGSKQKTCSACGDVVTESIDVLGHDYKSSSTAATCTNGGYITYTCNRCNDSYVENKAPATGHSYSNWVLTKEATCTETGSKQKTCSACGDVVTESVNALGHNWNSDYTVDKEATCTETGSKSIHCSVCNTTKDVTEISAKGHTSVNGGTSAIHTKCSVCGITLNSTHSYTNKVTKEATCTATGVRTYTCECGYSYTESIPAKGHTSVNGGTSAIHTKCSVCGTTLSSTHSYTKTTSIAATCTTKGTSKYTCSCGYSYTSQDIPAPGHTTVNGGTSAIHTKCSVCGTTLISAHSYTKTTVVAATCTTKGTSKYTCSCGYSYEATIPTKTHNIVAGECSNCDYNIPGLYDANGDLIVTWAESGINNTCSNASTVLANYPDVTKVIIPKGITSIGDDAFYSCSITSIVLPEGLTSIGSAAFDKCSITSIVLPEGLTSISDGAFYQAALTSVTFPSTLKTIGDVAFSLCKLTSVTLPEGLTSIGSSAFDSGTFTSIKIPESVTSIGSYAFAYCTNLSHVTFENPNGWYIGSKKGAKTTAISSSYLSNSSTAATYLKSTYSDKYWSK